MFNVSKGIVNTPAKILIYGPPGVGKTTFCAALDRVLIADLENGSHAINCERIEVNNIKELSNLFRWFKDQDYDTLVIDSFSKVQSFLTDDILSENNWDTLEKPGYGKGYEVLRQAINKFVKGCDYLVKNGKNVIIIAHTQVTLFNDPMMESYDRFEPAIFKKSISEVLASFDAVLFYKKKVVLKDAEKGNKQIALSKQDREMYSNERASFVAKNRFNLPDYVLNPNPKEYFNGIFQRGARTVSGTTTSEGVASSNS